MGAIKPIAVCCVYIYVLLKIKYPLIVPALDIYAVNVTFSLKHFSVIKRLILFNNRHYGIHTHCGALFAEMDGGKFFHHT